MLDVNDYVNEYTRDQENINLISMIRIVETVESRGGVWKAGFGFNGTLYLTALTGSD